MAKIETLHVKPVELLPRKLDNGVLYVSRKYKTAAHGCCCGCGGRVVTPLKPGGWALTGSNALPTLEPSVENGTFACNSHYLIIKGRVHWARQRSAAEVERTRVHDHQLRERLYTQKPKRRGILAWLKSFKFW